MRKRRLFFPREGWSLLGSILCVFALASLCSCGARHASLDTQPNVPELVQESLGVRVTVNYVDLSPSEVFKDLAERFNLNFVAVGIEPEKITLQAEDESLYLVLDKLAEAIGMRWSVVFTYDRERDCTYGYIGLQTWPSGETGACDEQGSLAPCKTIEEVAEELFGAGDFGE